MAQEVQAWKLGELADKVGGKLLGNPDTEIHRPVPAGYADEHGITFATDQNFLEKALRAEFGALIAPPETEPNGKNLILSSDPKRAFGVILAMMQRPLPLNEGVHSTASVSPSAEVHESAQIGPFVVIEAGAKIGADTQVFPFSYIGDHCSVGDQCKIFPNVTLYQDVSLGDFCIIHSGTVIGADGFGFLWDGEKQQKIPQVGSVIIGDMVEIGANCCIDRSTCGVTQLADGVKMDNLIQVGHNVRIDSHTVIAAQVGISGSVNIGKKVTMGGQVAISDHVDVGDDVVLGGRTGVTSSLDEPGQYFGLPATPMGVAMRAVTLQMRLPELFQRMRAMEREIESLKNDKDISSSDS